MHQRLNMVLDILGLNKDSESETSSKKSAKSEIEQQDANDVYYLALKKEKDIKFDFQNAIDKIYIDSLQKQDPDQINKNIYLGNLLQARTRKLLKKHKITTVIQISQKPLKKPFPEDFEYHRFIMTNDSIFDVYSALLKIARCINSQIVHKKCVLVHDWVSFEKAPACIIAYLIIYKSKGFYQAYELVKKQRPCINLSQQYVQILKGLQREFKKDLREKLLQRFKNMQLNLFVIIAKMKILFIVFFCKISIQFGGMMGAMGGSLGGAIGGGSKKTTIGNITIEPPKEPKQREPRAVVIQPMLVKPQQRVRNKLKRAFKNTGYDYNARNLYMHYNYPHSPFQFYSPNDKYSEMPMNIINYKGDPVRVDESQAVKKLKAKVKDETRNYMVDQNLVQQLNDKLTKVQENMKMLRNEILKGDVKLNAKIDLLKGSSLTIQLNILIYINENFINILIYYINFYNKKMKFKCTQLIIKKIQNIENQDHIKTNISNYGSILIKQNQKFMYQILLIKKYFI